MGNEQQKPTGGTQQAAGPAIQLDPSLIANIAAAVVAALRAEGIAGGGGQAPAVDMELLSTSVATAVTNGIAATTRRKVTFGEYQLRGHSPYHPKLKAETPVFKPNRTYFEHGNMISHATTTDAEVELLNQITHSGRYIDRRVEVSVRDGVGGHEDVFISFDNTITGQMEMSNYLYEAGPCKTKLEAILKLVVRAQAEERADAEERAPRAAQRRKFEGKDFDAAAVSGKKPWEVGA